MHGHNVGARTIDGATTTFGLGLDVFSAVLYQDSIHVLGYTTGGTASTTFVLDEHRTAITGERPFEYLAPDGFDAHAVFLVAGRLCLGGSVLTVTGQRTVSPRHLALAASDPAAANQLTPWELTAFEEREDVVTDVAAVFDATTGEAMPFGFSQNPPSFEVVLDGIRSADGVDYLLIGSGGSSPESYFADDLEIRSFAPGREPEVVNSWSGLGYSARQALLPAAEGQPGAAFETGAGDVYISVDGRSRLVARDATLAGVEHGSGNPVALVYRDGLPRSAYFEDSGGGSSRAVDDAAAIGGRIVTVKPGRQLLVGSSDSGYSLHNS